jgi:hypothetical protein
MPNADFTQPLADFSSLESYDFEDQLPPDTRRKLKEIFANWAEFRRVQDIARTTSTTSTPPSPSAKAPKGD